jgi:hypothetical protein
MMGNIRLTLSRHPLSRDRLHPGADFLLFSAELVPGQAASRNRALRLGSS